MSHQGSERELIYHLSNTQNENTKLRKEAEEYLQQNERQPRFGPIILRLLKESNIPGHVKVSAAIYLKNFIKKFYGLEEQIISPEDTKIIKEHVIELMLHSERVIQSLLCECVTLIAAKDFPQDWKELLPNLKTQIRPNTFQANLGVLKIIESITARFVGQEKTIPMVDSIQYICREFGMTWLTCLKEWSQGLGKAFGPGDADNKPNWTEEQLKELRCQVECVGVLVLIFHDLIGIDWIAFFDEHQKDWAIILRHLLMLDDKYKIFGNPDSATELEVLRTNVVKTLHVLVSNYDEFQDEVAGFVELVAQMVAKLNDSERYDTLVAESIQFLTAVSRQKWHQKLFADPNRLNNIVKYILIRNISLRESDVSMYETNCEDWVLRDMEGSDLFTRRRGAVDLIRGLSECFEDQVSDNILRYISRMTQDYEKDKAKNFAAMDAAINLVLALAVKKSTRQFGATEVNTKVGFSKFFEQYIIRELKEKSKTHDIIRADALKFVVVFRSQWDREMFLSLLSLACKFLKEEDYVLHTYAAIAVEKIITLRVSTNLSQQQQLSSADVYIRAPFKYPKEELLKHLKVVVESLFFVLEKRSDSHTNEYVMSSILQVVQRAQEGLIAVIGPLLQQSKNILMILSKNPQKPKFAHYLFETIAASIYFICKSDPSKVENFERELMETFFHILSKDTCTEFHPYVFQLIGMILRLRTKVNERYVDLFQKLLQQSRWQDDGTIQALSSMFEDYLRKVDVEEFVTKARLEGMLGIFSHLLSKRTQDYQAFRVLKAVFQFVPKSKLEPYLGKIFQLIFKRIAQRKSTQLCCEFVVCLALFILRYGLGLLMEIFDKIQPNILVMVIQSVWLEYARKIEDLLSRRILTIGMIRMITDPKFIQHNELKKSFPRMLQLVIEIFEIKPMKQLTAEEERALRLESLEDQGFSAKFTALSYAKPEPFDITSSLDDPRKLLVSSVARLLQNDKELIRPLSKALDARYVKVFNQYSQEFSVGFTIPLAEQQQQR